MLDIISSIILTQNQEALALVLSHKELLSQQEVSYLSYIETSYQNTSIYPSLDLMHDKFPELTLPNTQYSPSDLTVHISEFLTKRTNLYQSRQLMQIASKVSTQGLTDELLDSISTLRTNKSSNQFTQESYKDLYYAKKSKPQGLQTNIKVIDNLIGGLPYGHLMTIAGYTSHGKSLVANNIVCHNVMANKYNACIISLEVPKEDVLNNLLTHQSSLSEFSQVPYLPNQKLRKSTLSPEEESFLFDTLLPDFYDYSKHGKLVILDESDFTNLSQQAIRERLIQVDDECIKDTGYHLDIVDIDHINLLKFSGNKVSSPMEEGNQYISFFHKLAQNFRIDKDGSIVQLMVIQLVQINREGYRRAKKREGRYDLTALAEFNEAERASQEVMTVYMDDSMKINHEMTVQLLKNRSGVTEEEPQTVYVDPELYTVGDGFEGFNDSIQLSSLDDMFGSGSISDMFD